MRASALRLSIGVFIVAVLLLIAAVAALAFGHSDFLGWFAVSLFGMLVLVTIAEVAFRLAVRLRYGKPYRPQDRVAFADLYVIPHPYLPWVYRSDTDITNPAPLNYPLHPGEFGPVVHRTSSWGFVDGPGADRDVSGPKTNGEVRIACLGASTTGNYIQSGDAIFSYPSELEACLSEVGFPGVTVLNCGVGGYNSADIFVRFALQVVEFEPDCIIIYHAYNDIRAYQTPGLRADYSHSRRNLGEVYWRFYAADACPTFGLAVVDYLRAKYLVGNVRNSLLDVVSRGQVDRSIDPTAGLAVYRRNLQHIIDLARARGIQVVLSTYCHFLHDAIAADPLHRQYESLVARENEVMRELARANDVSLVDNAVLIPQEPEYFVDSIHFTPKGMSLLARNMATAIASLGLGTQREEQ